MASFNTAADSHFHGISGLIRSYVLSAVEGNLPNVKFCVGEDSSAPFVIATAELPRMFDSVPCDLRGPLVGDAPIGEEEVTYANRPGVSYRTWDSRLVAMPPKDSRLVTVIASMDGVITMFGGPLSPQEKDDPSALDPKASAEFWAEHALTHESLTREG